MTIIEKIAVDVVNSIVDAKRQARRIPQVALFITDGLAEKLVKRCGLADQAAARRVLDDMVIDGLLVKGPTAHDDYYAPMPIEIDSTL